MARIFVVDNREQPDPDPQRPIEGVKAMFADFYPEVATADTVTTPRGDDTVIEFRRRAGTKGEATGIQIPDVLALCDWRPVYCKEGLPVVLVVPDYTGLEALPYPGDIKPGYYTMPELVALLRAHAHHPEAVHFIADMLEP